MSMGVTKRTSIDRHVPCSTRLSSAGYEKSEKSHEDTTWQRLAEEKACLEQLDAERAQRGDSSYGKATEDRIVWSELIDLELQDIDEQVRRICREAGGGSGMSNNTPKSPSK
jgi:hypothetical protein